MGDTRMGIFSLAVWVVLVGHIVALATPNWIHVTYSNSAGTFVKVHFGFFQACITSGGPSVCTSFIGQGVFITDGALAKICGSCFGQAADASAKFWFALVCKQIENGHVPRRGFSA